MLTCRSVLVVGASRLPGLVALRIATTQGGRRSGVDTMPRGSIVTLPVAPKSGFHSVSVETLRIDKTLD